MQLGSKCCQVPPLTLRTELEGVVVENSPCEMGKPFKTLSLHSGLGNRRNLDISNVVISCGDLSQQSWFLVISKKTTTLFQPLTLQCGFTLKHTGAESVIFNSIIHHFLLLTDVKSGHAEQIYS